MKHITAKKLSAVFAVTFFSVGCLGFFSNPLVSEEGLFAINAAHNAVHILTAAGFLAGVMFPESLSRRILRWIAVAYTAVAVLGFFTEGHFLLGFVRINDADRWLHAALAIVIMAGSFSVSWKFQPNPLQNVTETSD